MDKPLCIYHIADLDGLCSGAIINFAHRNTGGVELMGYNYGWEVPWEQITGRDVIMADVSLQPGEKMLTLEHAARSFTWIDHHKSAIEEAEQLNLQAAGIRRIGQAACELVWEFFMDGAPVPETVRHLGRYDVWDHSDLNTLPFQYGARLHLESVDSPLWGALFQHNYDREQAIIHDGKTILAYQTAENKKRASAMAFETELDGLRCIAANVGLTNSQLFDSIWDPERHDAMMPFYRSAKGYWTVSLYSTKPEVDCSAVAKARGGGGHKGAAGFQCAELPFELKARNG